MQSNFQTQALVDHIVTNIPVVPPLSVQKKLLWNRQDALASQGTLADIGATGLHK